MTTWIAEIFPRNIAFKLLVCAWLTSLEFGLSTSLIASPPALCIVSPDHPATWDVGYNEKLNQQLHWSRKRHVLVASVTYSRNFFSQPGEQPIDYETYSLAFPEVCLDPTGKLYVVLSDNKKIFLGKLDDGVLGEQVNLAKGTAFSAHRKNGELWGLLEVKGASQ